MTIKEIEELSGMPRANIRFYEAEGLLRPDRDTNGYRNYSEEDLRILQKIRLLRALHVSLEDIPVLTRAIETVFAGDFRQMGAAALEKIRPYTMENMVRAHLDIWEGGK